MLFFFSVGLTWLLNDASNNATPTTAAAASTTTTTAVPAMPRIMGMHRRTPARATASSATSTPTVRSAPVDVATPAFGTPIGRDTSITSNASRADDVDEPALGRQLLATLDGDASSLAAAASSDAVMSGATKAMSDEQRASQSQSASTAKAIASSSATSTTTSSNALPLVASFTCHGLLAALVVERAGRYVRTCNQENGTQFTRFR